MAGRGVGHHDRHRLRLRLFERQPASLGLVDALVSVAGVHGSAARAQLVRLRAIVVVPWDAAMSVFQDHDVPKWALICENYLPNFDDLPPDCRGALLSLAYNRGPSFDNVGDRYAEMRAIKADMAAQNFSDIPAEFRSMKRLWPGTSMRGLVLRREHEARLFEQGLATMRTPT